MITYDDLKNRLQENSWPQNAIEVISASLNNIGPLSLDYLYMNCDGVREITANKIADIVSQFGDWRQEIQNNQRGSFIAALSDALRKDNSLINGLLSRFIFDIHSNKAISDKISAELNRYLFTFQLAQIEELPSAEFALALTTNPADLANMVDLQAELKRYSYYKDYDKDSRELQKFGAAIENSNQLIIDGNIKSGSQSIPGSVKNFIADYRQSLASTTKENSTYGVAAYLATSPNVKLLDKPHALVLRRILEAFSFLVYPRYTREEVEAYEEDRGSLLSALPYILLDQTPVFPDEDDEDEEKTPRTLQPLPQQQYVDELSRPVQPKPAAPQPVPKPAPKPQHQQPAQQPGVKMPHLAPDPKGISQRPSEITNPARVRELINHHPDPKPQPQLQRGIVHDATNIKIDEESNRIEQERQQKMDSIARKLEELRQRNKNQ